MLDLYFPPCTFFPCVKDFNTAHQFQLPKLEDQCGSSLLYFETGMTDRVYFTPVIR